jgi:cytoskeletal protein CcmA (bactofilin family)
MTTSIGADFGPTGTNRRQSFIDRDSHFSGTHATPNDFYLEGHFDGTVECAGALIVAESADVNAHVTAGSVSVAGHLQGDIGCRGRFEILPTGQVEARVQAGTIVVHEGARYEGELRMGGEGGIETPEQTGLPRRAEGRAPRRSATVETSDVPSFGAGTSRSNGRTTAPDDRSTRAATERTPQTGQSVTPEE